MISELAKYEFQRIIMWVCLSVLASGVAALWARWVLLSVSKVRKIVMFLGPIGCVLVLPGMVKMYLYGSEKEVPYILFDDYIANNGSSYVTNGVQAVAVEFKWRKTNDALPNSQPLYISKRLKNFGGDWDLAATTTVGAGSHLLTIENVKNYEYYIWHEWVPPSPVHTNGVWIGSVIEKAKNETGVNKMIIINGQLLKHGKVIAP